MENYVGKIVKISGTDSWHRPFSVTGIVYGQREGFKGDSTVFSLIKTNGTVADNVTVVHDDNIKITSTKIEPELREALKGAYKNKVRFDAFEKKYREERELLDVKMKESLKCVKTASGEMTLREFAEKVENMFCEKYPSTGGYYSKYFSLSSYSSTEITMGQRQDIEKWANPEKYGFIYREYDETLHIMYSSKEYERFCQNNAPAVIPQLAKYCKTDVCAGLGDKGWLTAERTYTFAVKYGCTQKSLDDIKERILGELVKSVSLEDTLARATERSSKTGSRGNGKDDYLID